MYIIRLVLLCALSLNFASAQNNILIKNGRILDGTGNSWYYSDLYVSNGIIQHIGKNLQFKADKIIDAHGLIVAPGFIDVHAHIEGGIMSKSTADNYLFDGGTANGDVFVEGFPGKFSAGLKTLDFTYRLRFGTDNTGSSQTGTYRVHAEKL